MSRSPLSRPQSLLAAGGMCAVSLVFLLFIASPVQAALGMTGLLLTELGLLALALGGAKLLGEPLRTVFPLARPRLRPTAGAVVLWLGIYAPVLLVAILMQLLLPQHTAEVSTGITGLISTVPLWLRFLIVAVSPAICEEAVYRGFILHHLGVLPPWARVLLCGALFGVFHLDVTRFGSTALLGVALSWAAVCTGTDSPLQQQRLGARHRRAGNGRRSRARSCRHRRRSRRSRYAGHPRCLFPPLRAKPLAALGRHRAAANRRTPAPRPRQAGLPLPCSDPRPPSRRLCADPQPGLIARPKHKTAALPISGGRRFCSLYNISLIRPSAA